MYEEERQEHQQMAETYNLLFIVLAVCAIGLFFLGNINRNNGIGVFMFPHTRRGFSFHEKA